MKYISLAVKVVILLALLLLAVKNTQTVDFFYSYDGSVHWPLIVLLMLFFVIGTVFGILALLGRLLSLRSQVVRLQRELQKQSKPAYAAPVTSAGAVAEAAAVRNNPPQASK